jgi:hypothetical protein
MHWAIHLGCVHLPACWVSVTWALCCHPGSWDTQGKRGPGRLTGAQAATHPIARAEAVFPKCPFLPSSLCWTPPSGSWLAVTGLVARWWLQERTWGSAVGMVSSARRQLAKAAIILGRVGEHSSAGQPAPHCAPPCSPWPCHAPCQGKKNT